MRVRSKRAAKTQRPTRWPPGVPRHAVRTERPRLVRAYPVRTVRGALGASRPAPPVRTQRGRLVRVAGTYPTEAPGRTCQLGWPLMVAKVPTSLSRTTPSSPPVSSMSPGLGSGSGWGWGEGEGEGEGLRVRVRD